MKQIKRICAVPILGVLAMAVRWALYALGCDERGLLVPGRPEIPVLLVLTAAAAVLSFLAQEPEKTYSGSVTALGWCAMALGLALTRNLPATTAPVLRLLFALSRFGGAAMAIALAWFARKKQMPVFGLSAGLCVCFVLQLVGSYQMWSRDPQIQNYLFALLAGLALAAFSYQHAALELGLGSRQWQRRFALLGCFFCFAASIGKPCRFSYGYMGLCLFIQALSPAPEKSV